MSGVHGAFIGHLVRRGMMAAHEHMQGMHGMMHGGMGMSNETMERLQHDAHLYENAGRENEIKPQELLPIFITALLALLLMASVRYTIGDVMASLAMIESPKSTAVIEPKLPAYSEVDPDFISDASLEKEPLVPTEDTDVEITVVNHKPITAKITTTIGHLQRVGGFRARWRGIGISILYDAIHGLITHSFAGLLGLGLLGNAFIYILVSVGLARLHMLWTHSMIAYPSSRPWYQRFVPRKNCKPVLLPSLVYAAAQQATVLIPMALAFSFDLHHVSHGNVIKNATHKNCGMMMLMGLKFLAVPASAIFIGFAVLLPAAVTLTRVESLLLPEDEETIVNFDRAAVLGDIDLSARGGSRALFVHAWRSFDRSARWRLIKIYAKMVLIQFTVAIIAIHLAIAEIYIIGGERLGVFLKSAAAQLQLMAIEAKKKAN